MGLIFLFFPWFGISGLVLRGHLLVVRKAGMPGSQFRNLDATKKFEKHPSRPAGLGYMPVRRSLEDVPSSSQSPLASPHEKSFDPSAVPPPSLLSGSTTIGGSNAFKRPPLPPPPPPRQLPPGGVMPFHDEDEKWLTALLGNRPLPRPVGHEKGPKPQVGMNVLMRPAGERVRVERFGDQGSEGTPGILSVIYEEQGEGTYVWVKWKNGYGNWYACGWKGSYELYQRPPRESKIGHEREQEIEVVKEFERKTLGTLPEAWSGLKTYGSDIFGAGGITEGCDSLDDWWRRLVKARHNQGVPGFDTADAASGGLGSSWEDVQALLEGQGPP